MMLLENWNMMKVVAISDMHGFLEKPENMPEGDVLCICGDIVPLDYQSDYEQSIAWFCLEFVPWTDSLPYKKVIFVGGNHDFFLEKMHKKPFMQLVQDVDGEHYETWYKFDSSSSRILKKLLPGNNKGKHKLIYLCDNSIEIEGKTFYGTPWIQDLERWAFYLPEDQLQEKWNKIPKKLDVFMSHMPPKYKGVGEVLQRGQYNTSADYGSQTLADAIIERDIKFAISGHVHSGCHQLQESSEGHYLANVSIKDEDYKVQYYPLVFEI